MTESVWYWRSCSADSGAPPARRGVPRRGPRWRPRYRSWSWPERPDVLGPSPTIAWTAASHLGGRQKDPLHTCVRNPIKTKAEPTYAKDVGVQRFTFPNTPQLVVPLWTKVPLPGCWCRPGSDSRWTSPSTEAWTPCQHSAQVGGWGWGEKKLK